MRWSRLFIPTLRQQPADAEAPSHACMLRAGYIRQLSAGLFSYLLPAQRSMLKIAAIIRQEMDAIGAQEIHLTALHPAETWKATGRWDAMGGNLFRLKDRWQRDYCLGMTHEEVVTALARGELRSYKQLPQIWYQIQTKFRDEPRPKAGLLRVREFLMKDSYSFDIDAAGLEISYQKHFHAYGRIFDRCGLQYFAVEAHSGAMGGSQSHEFMVRCPAGEDLVAVAPKSGYRANLEKAVSDPVPPRIPDPEGNFSPEPFHTPGRKSIAEVAEFTGLPETSQIKSLVMVAGGKPLLALLRGDHALNEAKLSAVAGASEVRPAHPEEIREWFAAGAGSLGPVGVSEMPILADLALRERRNMICGANRDDYHLRNVTPGVDFQAAFHDLRLVAPGDTCPDSGEPLEIWTTVEIGHIFKLGYRYSQAMGLRVLNEQGSEITPVMGSYGIGLERILCAAIELYHDKDGIVLPPSIAPFSVVITPVNVADETQRQTAERLYSDCLARSIDAVLDDRDERPGVKFKDSDLVGIPFRITVGRNVQDGLVELSRRKDRSVQQMPLDQVCTALERFLHGG